MWIIPVIVVAIVLAIFIGYNAVYMKQDAASERGVNMTQPDAPG